MFAIGCGICTAPGISNATEGGGSSKALGVDTVLAGVMPPPGLWLTMFFASYNPTHTLDSSGNDRAGLSNFELNANAATARLQYIWPNAELFGGTIETRVGFTLYADVRVHFDAQTPVGQIHRAGSASGIGDALVGPLILGWHSDRFHQKTGVEIYIPTGKFDRNQLISVSRGYYAIGPHYWFTWFPVDGVEISGSLVYLLNLKNHDSGYQSGDELSFDYGLGYDVTPPWQVGASGYLYKQVMDDKLNGQVVGDGNRGRAVAIGPFIRYHTSQDWGVTFKWQHEALIENKTRGERFILQFAYKFW